MAAVSPLWETGERKRRPIAGGRSAIREEAEAELAQQVGALHRVGGLAGLAAERRGEGAGVEGVLPADADDDERHGQGDGAADDRAGGAARDEQGRGEREHRHRDAEPEAERVEAEHQAHEADDEVQRRHPARIGIAPGSGQAARARPPIASVAASTSNT